MSRLSWNAGRCNHLSLNTQPERRLSKTIVEQQAPPDSPTCLAPNPPAVGNPKVPAPGWEFVLAPEQHGRDLKAFRG